MRVPRLPDDGGPLTAADKRLTNARARIRIAHMLGDYAERQDELEQELLDAYAERHRWAAEPPQAKLPGL